MRLAQQPGWRSRGSRCLPGAGPQQVFEIAKRASELKKPPSGKEFVSQLVLLWGFHRINGRRLNIGVESYERHHQIVTKNESVQDVMRDESGERAPGTTGDEIRQAAEMGG